MFFLLAALLMPGIALADSAKLNSGDTAWMITATALVLLMTIPGLALFYGGMVGKKDVLSVCMQAMSVTGLVSVLWVVAGYSLAFGEGGAYVGDLSKAFLAGVGVDTLSGTIPETVFAMFQMTFAIITPVLIVGAFAERMKFSAMLAFMGIWVLAVYAPVCHWVWGGGFLGNAGALDFAGGTVVHINAGVSGLVITLVLGKRIGFPAVLAWTFAEWVVYKKPSLLGACSGAVAGLVTITPASGFVGPVGALAIGLAAGLVCFWSVAFLKKAMGYDDSLDAFGVHAIGGIVGALLTGVFCAKSLGGTGFSDHATSIGGQLAIQAEAVLATIIYDVVATFIILKILDVIIGLRVSSDEEIGGLDITQHGEQVYDTMP